MPPGAERIEFRFTLIVFFFSSSCLRWFSSAISRSISSFCFFSSFFDFNRDWKSSYRLKNMGASSASHCASTAVTHRMYSLVVITSSW